MLSVDMMFYTSARELAKAKTLDSLKTSSELLSYYIDKARGIEAKCSTSFAVLKATQDELKLLIRQAKNEPAKAGIQFPLVLFESIEASFRSISFELGTLHHVFFSITGNVDQLFNDSEGGVSESVLKRLNALCASRFADIGFLLTDLFDRQFVPADEDEDSSKAGLLRHQILDKTYNAESEDADQTLLFMSNLKRKTFHTKTRLVDADAVAKTNTSWCCCCNRRRRVLPNEFQEKDIPLSYQQRIHMMRSLLVELRGTAEILRGGLPTKDGLSHIELLVHVVGNIDAELQKVCLALAK
eukprot:TRINITY_DN17353_c0_g1_i1.p1 TRINITY_DN17353_c0_g1~~TRINITY_DN17353_c0_g1_i1.p1  ORF type:complete len:299 (+),score=61.40 TRINITY_DN17353_c0_g1_i1:439-1335(+)